MIWDRCKSTVACLLGHMTFLHLRRSKSNRLETGTPSFRWGAPLYMTSTDGYAPTLPLWVLTFAGLRESRSNSPVRALGQVCV